MGVSPYEFWADVPGDARWHPADAQVLDRVQHTFVMDCLPNPFFGPLRKAQVVFLFLSPGFRDEDLGHANAKAGQDYYERQRSGVASLPTKEDYAPTWKWWTRTVHKLGFVPVGVLDRIAFLNIGAYRSKSFVDYHMLSALPSSRVCLSWAQSVLFPQAEAGERVVVCLRAARCWGLGTGRRYGSLLFAPEVTRRGDMIHGAGREAVIGAMTATLSAG